MNEPLSSSDTDSPYLSTVQVAKAVGVSVTTIKRWVDDGVLTAHRTAGGHRKLILADVLRLTREGLLPTADLSQLATTAPRTGPTTVEAFRERLRDAVKRYDTEAVRAILRGAHQSRLSIVAIADQLVAPTMAEVGREWEHGRIGVGKEHLITQAVIAALYDLRQRMLTHTPKDRPVAVGGAPEHDHYVMPTLLAKLTLLEGGWNAINLGPNTPASAVVDALDVVKPRLIWMAVTHVEDASAFERDFKELFQAAHARGIPVSIGGQGLTPELRGRLPYTSYGDSLAHFAAFARSLNPPARPPKRGRPRGKAT